MGWYNDPSLLPVTHIGFVLGEIPKQRPRVGQYSGLRIPHLSDVVDMAINMRQTGIRHAH